MVEESKMHVIRIGFVMLMLLLMLMLMHMHMHMHMQVRKPPSLGSWVDIRAVYREFYSRRPQGLANAMKEVLLVEIAPGPGGDPGHPGGPGFRGEGAQRGGGREEHREARLAHGAGGQGPRPTPWPRTAACCRRRGASPRRGSRGSSGTGGGGTTASMLEAQPCPLVWSVEVGPRYGSAGRARWRSRGPAILPGEELRVTPALRPGQG